MWKIVLQKMRISEHVRSENKLTIINGSVKNMHYIAVQQ